MKFSELIDNENVAYAGHDQFEVIRYSSGTECVLARVSTSPIDFIKDLIQDLTDNAYLLYILKVQRTPEWDPARYQSPLMSTEEARQVLDRFGPFLAGDGRHDFWMYWPDVLHLIYDRHERFFLYGEIAELTSKLTGLGLKQETVQKISAPHGHHYHDEFDEDLNTMLNLFEWQKSPLRDSDHE